MKQKPYEKITLFWLIVTQLMNEPLFIMYGFSTIILRKMYVVDELIIAFFVSVKPVMSILSFYWGAHLAKRPDFLRKNFFFANILGRLPFLFFPWFVGPWFLIFSATTYILFYRAAKPAWIEILRLNASQEKKRKAFSWGFALSYLEGMVFALFFGVILDVYADYWVYLFFFSAIIGFINLYFLGRLPIFFEKEQQSFPEESWKNWLVSPWMHAKRLLELRADFAKFQLGFMLCGFGLMFIQPALALLLVDILDISYLRFGLAYTSWKGICIALSSPIWSNLMKKYSVFSLSSAVFFFASLLPFSLLLSTQNIFWLYLGYIFYGIAQGGSQLIWNLSGPIFSGNEDSAPYTATNVLAIGLRGCIAPFLGAWITKLFSPFFALFLGGLFCLWGAFFVAPSKEEVYVK